MQSIAQILLDTSGLEMGTAHQRTQRAYARDLLKSLSQKNVRPTLLAITGWLKDYRREGIDLTERIIRAKNTIVTNTTLCPTLVEAARMFEDALDLMQSLASGNLYEFKYAKTIITNYDVTLLNFLGAVGESYQYYNDCERRVEAQDFEDVGSRENSFQQIDEEGEDVVKRRI